MSTEFFNDQWRIPSDENQNKISNYSMKSSEGNTDITVGDSSGDLQPANISVSTWFKCNDQSVNFNYLISKVDNPGNLGYAIYFGNSDDKLQFFITDETGFIITPYTPIISDNNWHHVVGTYNGKNLKLYIDGNLRASATSTTGIEYNGGDLIIGAQTNTSQRSFEGSLDQTTIFNYALPETGTNSVATLYGGGTAVTNPMVLSPAPIAYYQLGDQSVSTGPSADYLVPNNSLQDYVFFFPTTSSTARISVPSRTNSSTATISLWVNYDSLGTGFAANVVIGLGTTGYWPYLQNTSGKFHFYINTPSSPSQNVITTVDVVLNKWFHIALSDDGTNTKAYINGVPQGTMTSVANAVFDTIGAYSNGNFSTDGRMSNVAYWQNTNLSDAQILSIYNNGVPNDISSLNPTSWWKLNAQDTFNSSTSVWTINDYGSSGTDGTSNNMDSSNLVQSDLQHTSGYSPYALDFDGTNDVINCGNDSSLQITGAMTVSYWFKGLSANASATGVGKLGNNGTRGFALTRTNGNAIYFFIAPTASSLVSAVATPTLSNTQWYHLVGVYTPSTSMVIYLNGVPLTSTQTGSVPASQYNGSNNLQIGNRGDNSAWFNGEISNVAIWNTNLSAAEITSIYNQGVPSNLNTFSGTAPVSWWQIGSNSSFNPNPTGAEGRWTCLDEIGTNNGESSNSMTNDAITNGPGYSANGLGTSSIEIVGDAPYSTANGLSENMDVLDRVSGSGNVPG
jgi:hypothetical protein